MGYIKDEMDGKKELCMHDAENWKFRFYYHLQLSADGVIKIEEVFLLQVGFNNMFQKDVYYLNFHFENYYYFFFFA